MLGIFQDGAKACEELLEERWYEVDLTVNELNPNLHTLYQGRGSAAAEDVWMFHRSLRIATKFLDEELGYSDYSKKLDNNNVPPLEFFTSVNAAHEDIAKTQEPGF